MRPTHTQAQKTVAGARFPATRDVLVDHARSRGADEELLACLNLLPPGTYRDPNEVGAAFAVVTDEATG